MPGFLGVVPMSAQLSHRPTTWAKVVLKNVEFLRLPPSVSWFGYRLGNACRVAASSPTFPLFWTFVPGSLGSPPPRIYFPVNQRCVESLSQPFNGSLMSRISLLNFTDPPLTPNQVHNLELAKQQGFFSPTVSNQIHHFAPAKPQVSVSSLTSFPESSHPPPPTHWQQSCRFSQPAPSW